MARSDYVLEAGGLTKWVRGVHVANGADRSWATVSPARSGLARPGSRISATPTLRFLSLAVGCVRTWYRAREESPHD